MDVGYSAMVAKGKREAHKNKREAYRREDRRTTNRERRADTHARHLAKARGDE